MIFWMRPEVGQYSSRLMRTQAREIWDLRFRAQGFSGLGLGGPFPHMTYDISTGNGRLLRPILACC